MTHTEPSPFKITRQNTDGIQGGPERTVHIEGPTTKSQTHELASRAAPLILGFLVPFQGTLTNIGGIPSSDDQIILSLSDSDAFQVNIKARFELITSREIRFSQHPQFLELPTPLPQVTEFVTGLSWYRPTRFALFNVGTPTLNDYFELQCASTLSMKIGTTGSRESLKSSEPRRILSTLLEILAATHGVKYSHFQG